VEVREGIGVKALAIDLPAWLGRTGQASTRRPKPSQRFRSAMRGSERKLPSMRLAAAAARGSDSESAAGRRAAYI
jgi:hypothetical protein